MEREREGRERGEGREGEEKKTRGEREEKNTNGSGRGGDVEPIV